MRRLAARGLLKQHTQHAGLLITPKPHWPLFTSTLTMVESEQPIQEEVQGVEAPLDQTWLRYHHDATYQVCMCSGCSRKDMFR